MSAGPPLAVLIKIDPEWAEHCRASGLSSGEGLIYRVRNPKWESKGAGKEPKMTDPGRHRQASAGAGGRVCSRVHGHGAQGQHPLGDHP